MMKIFGVKSIGIAMAVQCIAVFLFIEYAGLVFFAVELTLFVFFFLRIVLISNNIVTFFFPFPFKFKGVLLGEIRVVHFSDGGLAIGLTTISFQLKDNTVRKIFMLMYPFERRQLGRYLESEGVEVDGNGI